MQKRSLLLLSCWPPRSRRHRRAAPNAPRLHWPTTTSSSAEISAPSLLGTWVGAGASTPAVTASSVTVPDFRVARISPGRSTNQTATEASGRFSAECGTGLRFQRHDHRSFGGATIHRGHWRADARLGHLPVLADRRGHSDRRRRSHHTAARLPSTIAGRQHAESRAAFGPIIHDFGAITDGTSGGVLRRSK